MKKLSATDFKTDTTQNSRIGYCSACGGCSFYDKYQIHMEQSECCGKDLLPCRA